MHANSSIFSSVAIARARLVTLGAPGALFRRVVDSVRSLKDSDHLSITRLVADEIQRKSATGVICGKSIQADVPLADELLLGLIRRWFWSRRRSRGFIIEGFPASVAQATVFDEWLEARDEALTACVYVDHREAQLLDEALRTWMCPADGSTYVESVDVQIVPGFCNHCRGSLENIGPRQSDEIRRWFRVHCAAVERVAEYYQDRGLLVRASESQTVETEADRLLRRITELVVDR